MSRPALAGADRTALIGSTGFVGGNLARQRSFTDGFDSRTAPSIAGRHYDLVVFSAAKAEKWRINQDPEADLAHIAELEALLSSFTTDRLVLISTVDVYKDPRGVDELTPIDTDGLQPYGLHRYRLEQFAANQHPGALVVRLPGLFGPGLKKNVIFDLLNDNNVDRINPDGSFQYYNLNYIASDLESAITANLPLVNVATEPVVTRDLAETAFGVGLAPVSGPAGSYDMHTRHADRFGAMGDYLYSRESVIDDVAAFVETERGARA